MKNLELRMEVYFYKADPPKLTIHQGWCGLINNLIPLLDIHTQIWFYLSVHYHTHKFASVHASYLSWLFK